MVKALIISGSFTFSDGSVALSLPQTEDDVAGAEGDNPALSDGEGLG
jgi:hypothetical protein